MERYFKRFEVNQANLLFIKIMKWGQIHFSTCCFLNSNHYTHDKYSRFNQALALGVANETFGNGIDDFSELKRFSDKYIDWLFGFVTYDLKNQLESLESSNHNGIDMPLIHFFRPIVLIFPGTDHLEIGCLKGFGNFSDPDFIFNEITCFVEKPLRDLLSPEMKPRVPRERYLHQVGNIRQNIQLGYIYEMNYCVEFYSENAIIDPLIVYDRLSRISPTPFSGFYQLSDKYLMCASPERFLRKQGEKLISQPIKGTVKRGSTPQEDELLKKQLFEDPKERSENVMIVDLVRNDLSRSAKKGSVRVEELFGIYSFSKVHQMVSTVVSEIRPDVHFVDAIRFAFPMGSMTGAPKIQAMKLIENYEDTRRGLYSGAVGYISPEKDFDFNVVIRSVLYNQSRKYLSYMAGSAITIASVPEKEYQECLLKAAAMQEALCGDELKT